MHMIISSLLERRRASLFLLYMALVAAVIFIPTMFASATSIGTNISVTGTLTVTGASTFNGSVTIGDDATEDTITVTARLAADLDPNANNTIDLGAFGLAYNNIYVSSTAFLSSATTTMIEPWANNTSNLGAFGNAWSDFFASGTVNIAGAVFNESGAVTVGTSTANTLTVTARLAADLDPNANNTIDMGAYGLAYNDFFASGTIFAASSTFSHPTASTTALYGKAEAASVGAQIILEDTDGAGCTAIMVLNGSVNGTTINCPDS